MLPSKYLLWFCISSFYIYSVIAIDCYQCNSTDHINPFQCTEFLGNVDLKPQPCTNVFEARYCVKHTGRFEGGLGTKRFCSHLDLGNYCNYIKQPGDELEYRSCVYTCSTYGCNKSLTITPLLLLLIVAGISCLVL